MIFCSPHERPQFFVYLKGCKWLRYKVNNNNNFSMSNVRRDCSSARIGNLKE